MVALVTSTAAIAMESARHVRATVSPRRRGGTTMTRQGVWVAAVVHIGSLNTAGGTSGWPNTTATKLVTARLRVKTYVGGAAPSPPSRGGGAGPSRGLPAARTASFGTRGSRQRALRRDGRNNPVRLPVELAARVLRRDALLAAAEPRVTAAYLELLDDVTHAPSPLSLRE
jgi:hypothetical protein